MAGPDSIPASPSARIDAEVREFSSSIFHLVKAGDRGRIRSLLERGIDPDLRNERGESLLFLASQHGQLDVAVTLLDSGAAADLADGLGQTPLAKAAFKNDAAMVDVLLSHGARVDRLSPEGQTALMLAALYDQGDLVDVLLSHGASPVVRDPQGRTARDYAEGTGARNALGRIAPS